MYPILQLLAHRVAPRPSVPQAFGSATLTERGEKRDCDVVVAVAILKVFSAHLSADHGLESLSKPHVPFNRHSRDRKGYFSNIAH